MENKIPATITLRASPELRRQVEALCVIWGESMTNVVRRCIEREYGRNERFLRHREKGLVK